MNTESLIKSLVVILLGVLAINFIGIDLNAFVVRVGAAIAGVGN